MAQLLKSARLLVSDLAATIAFLAVLVATKELMLAVVIGVALGAAQIGWLVARGRPIAAMQWLSISLVIVSGLATLLTRDVRFLVWGIASKLALFVGQFAVMRTIGARRRAPSLAANIRYRPEEA